MSAFVFDFDDTLIDVNSDDVLIDMVQGALPSAELPELAHTDLVWADYLGHVMRLGHEHGISRSAIEQTLESIRFPGSSLRLLQFLRDQGWDIYIVSAANQVTIRLLSDKIGFATLIKEVFTHPAHFDDSGRLHVSPHHPDGTGLHQCENGCTDICKGFILDKLMDRYERICYAGDGDNDVCPSMRLKEGHTVFARRGYPIHSILEGKGDSLRANMVLWGSQDDLLHLATQHLQ